MAMFNLIYVSSATVPFTESELLELLEISRRNNALIEVTGLLLYRDGNFMQVLEGEEDQVRTVHDRITRDSRHTGLITLLAAPIPERTFAGWSMAFRNLNSPELKNIPGFDQFLNENWRMSGDYEGPNQAMKVLHFFRKNMR